MYEGSPIKDHQPSNMKNAIESTSTQKIKETKSENKKNLIKLKLETPGATNTTFGVKLPPNSQRPISQNFQSNLRDSTDKNEHECTTR